MSKLPIDPAVAHLLAGAGRGAAIEFLLDMIDGTINLNDLKLIERLEPIFHAYQYDPQVAPLIERAANAYSDAALAAAYRYFTDRVCDAARHGTFNKFREDLHSEPDHDE